MSAFLVGIALGAFYFGGLYFSIKKLTEVKYPRLLMLISWVFRMLVLLGVFLYVARGGFQQILLALLGLMLMRLVITQITKEKESN